MRQLLRNADPDGHRTRVVARVVGLASLIAFFFLWEAIARGGFQNARSFPPPSAIARGLLLWASDGLLRDTLVSLRRVLVGVAAGALLGLALGIAGATIPLVRWITQPVIQLFRPIPPIALVTITVIWFGIGEASKHFLIGWSVFFQVWISSYLGVSKVDCHLLWAGRSLGAKGADLIWRVSMPAALPVIVVGLRTGIGVGYFSLIAAELAGSFSGLGYRIDLSSSFFRSDVMLAAILVLGVIGALTDGAFALLIDRFFPWYRNPAT